MKRKLGLAGLVLAGTLINGCVSGNKGSEFQPARKEEISLEEDTLLKGLFWPWLEPAAEERRRQKERAREIARENMIYSQQSQQQDRYYEKVIEEESQNSRFFACNYFKDFNNSGTGDYPEEYVGIKSKFKKYEGIRLISYVNVDVATLTKMNMQIYNPGGEKILDLKESTPSNVIPLLEKSGTDLTNFLLQNGGLGAYKAVWYLEKNFVGMCEFEITE